MSFESSGENFINLQSGYTAMHDGNTGCRRFLLRSTWFFIRNSAISTIGEILIALHGDLFKAAMQVAEVPSYRRDDMVFDLIGNRDEPAFYCH